MPAPTHQDKQAKFCSKEKRFGMVVDNRPVANTLRASAAGASFFDIFGG